MQVINRLAQLLRELTPTTSEVDDMYTDELDDANTHAYKELAEQWKWLTPQDAVVPEATATWTDEATGYTSTPVVVDMTLFPPNTLSHMAEFYTRAINDKEVTVSDRYSHSWTSSIHLALDYATLISDTYNSEDGVDGVSTKVSYLSEWFVFHVWEAIEIYLSQRGYEQLPSWHAWGDGISDYRQLPWNALWMIAREFTKNCEDYGGKYPRMNYKKNDNYMRQLASFWQHYVSFLMARTEPERDEHMLHMGTRASMYLENLLDH